MNVLITGITGFLGRNLVKYILQHRPEINIIGMYNSEKKHSIFSKKYKNITTYKQNLTSTTFRSCLINIIKKHKINYIIHSAAMKHVNICEENPICAINTNIVASNIIVEEAINNNIKNVICISTDKSNTPFNIYGMSKNIMERIVLKHGFSIYQGANFFGSDGSVLDIWLQQYLANEELHVSDVECYRFFNNIDYISKLLIQNLDCKNKIILPDHVLKIKLDTLLKAFLKKFDYNKFKITGLNSFEKTIETLDTSITDIKELNVTECQELLNDLYTNYKICF